MKVEDQCAVLVGGYADDNAAHRALARLKQQKPPDPKKVTLYTKYYQVETEKEKRAERVYVNPFRSAFVARNPTTKTERPQDWDKLDVAALKRMNSQEPYSLLQCPKPVTLAIKMVHTPTVVQPKSFSGAFLETLGLGTSEREGDVAAQSAHNLAEYLRKTMNLPAYVLHTKFYSLVTIGEFEGLQDPALRATQTQLPEQLKHLAQVQLFPNPVAMQVPH
jgi:hypothetical protein